MIPVQMLRIKQDLQKLRDSVKKDDNLSGICSFYIETESPNISDYLTPFLCALKSGYNQKPFLFVYEACHYIVQMSVSTNGMFCEKQTSVPDKRILCENDITPVRMIPPEGCSNQPLHSKEEPSVLIQSTNTHEELIETLLDLLPSTEEARIKILQIVSQLIPQTSSDLLFKIFYNIVHLLDLFDRKLFNVLVGVVLQLVGCCFVRYLKSCDRVCADVVRRELTSEDEGVCVMERGLGSHVTVGVDKRSSEPRVYDEKLHDPKLPNKDLYDPKSLNKDLYDPKSPNKDLYDPKSLDRIPYDPKSPNKDLYDPKSPDKDLYDPKSPDRIPYDSKSSNRNLYDPKLPNNDLYYPKSPDRNLYDPKSLDTKPLVPLDRTETHSRISPMHNTLTSSPSHSQAFSDALRMLSDLKSLLRTHNPLFLRVTLQLLKAPIACKPLYSNPKACDLLIEVFKDLEGLEVVNCGRLNELVFECLRVYFHLSRDCMKFRAYLGGRGCNSTEVSLFESVSKSYERASGTFNPHTSDINAVKEEKHAGINDITVDTNNSSGHDGINDITVNTNNSSGHAGINDITVNTNNSSDHAGINDINSGHLHNDTPNPQSVRRIQDAVIRLITARNLLNSDQFIAMLDVRAFEYLENTNMLESLPVIQVSGKPYKHLLKTMFNSLVSSRSVRISTLQLYFRLFTKYVYKLAPIDEHYNDRVSPRGFENVGSVNANVGSVNANVGSVNANVGSVNDNVGLVNANVDRINPNVDRINDNVDRINDNVDRINPNVGPLDRLPINEESIDGNVSRIESDFILTNVRNLLPIAILLKEKGFVQSLIHVDCLSEVATVIMDNSHIVTCEFALLFDRMFGSSFSEVYEPLIEVCESSVVRNGVRYAVEVVGDLLTQKVTGIDTTPVKADDRGFPSDGNDRGFGPVKDGTETTLMNDGDKTSLMNDIQGSSLMKDNQGSSLMKDSQGSPLMKDIQGSSLMKDIQGSPLMKDIQGSSLMKDIQGSSLMKDSQGSPLMKDIQGSPLMNDENLLSKHGGGNISIKGNYRFQSDSPEAQKSVFNNTHSIQREGRRWNFFFKQSKKHSEQSPILSTAETGQNSITNGIIQAFPQLQKKDQEKVILSTNNKPLLQKLFYENAQTICSLGRGLSHILTVFYNDSAFPTVVRCALDNFRTEGLLFVYGRVYDMSLVELMRTYIETTTFFDTRSISETGSFFETFLVSFHTKYLIERDSNGQIRYNGHCTGGGYSMGCSNTDRHCNGGGYSMGCSNTDRHCNGGGYSMELSKVESNSNERRQVSTCTERHRFYHRITDSIPEVVKKLDRTTKLYYQSFLDKPQTTREERIHLLTSILQALQHNNIPVGMVYGIINREICSVDCMEVNMKILAVIAENHLQEASYRGRMEFLGFIREVGVVRGCLNDCLRVLGIMNDCLTAYAVRLTEQNISGVGLTERNMSGIGSTHQNISGIGSTDQNISGIGSTDQNMSGIGSTERNMSGIGSTEQNMSGMGSTCQNMSGIGSTDQNMSGIGSTDQNMSGNNPPQSIKSEIGSTSDGTNDYSHSGIEYVGKVSEDGTSVLRLEYILTILRIIHNEKMLQFNDVYETGIKIIIKFQETLNDRMIDYVLLEHILPCFLINGGLFGDFRSVKNCRQVGCNRDGSQTEVDFGSSQSRQNCFGDFSGIEGIRASFDGLVERICTDLGREERYLQRLSELGSGVKTFTPEELREDSRESEQGIYHSGCLNYQYGNLINSDCLSAKGYYTIHNNTNASVTNSDCGSTPIDFVGPNSDCVSAKGYYTIHNNTNASVTDSDCGSTPIDFVGPNSDCLSAKGYYTIHNNTNASVTDFALLCRQVDLYMYNQLQKHIGHPFTHSNTQTTRITHYKQIMTNLMNIICYQNKNEVGTTFQFILKELIACSGTTFRDSKFTVLFFLQTAIALSHTNDKVWEDITEMLVMNITRFKQCFMYEEFVSKVVESIQRFDDNRVRMYEHILDCYSGCRRDAAFYGNLGKFLQTGCSYLVDKVLQIMEFDEGDECLKAYGSFLGVCNDGVTEQKVLGRIYKIFRDNKVLIDGGEFDGARLERYSCKKNMSNESHSQRLELLNENCNGQKSDQKNMVHSEILNENCNGQKLDQKNMVHGELLNENCNGQKLDQKNRVHEEILNGNCNGQELDQKNMVHGEILNENCNGQKLDQKNMVHGEILNENCNGQELDQKNRVHGEIFNENCNGHKLDKKIHIRSTGDSKCGFDLSVESNQNEVVGSVPCTSTDGDNCGTSVDQDALEKIPNSSRRNNRSSRKGVVGSQSVTEAENSGNSITELQNTVGTEQTPSTVFKGLGTSQNEFKNWNFEGKNTRESAEDSVESMEYNHTAVKEAAELFENKKSLSIPTQESLEYNHAAVKEASELFKNEKTLSIPTQVLKKYTQYLNNDITSKSIHINRLAPFQYETNQTINLQTILNIINKITTLVHDPNLTEKCLAVLKVILQYSREFYEILLSIVEKLHTIYEKELSNNENDNICTYFGTLNQGSESIEMDSCSSENSCRNGERMKERLLKGFIEYFVHFFIEYVEQRKRLSEGRTSIDAGNQRKWYSESDESVFRYLSNQHGQNADSKFANLANELKYYPKNHESTSGLFSNQHGQNAVSKSANLVNQQYCFAENYESTSGDFSNAFGQNADSKFANLANELKYYPKNHESTGGQFSNGWCQGFSNTVRHESTDFSHPQTHDRCNIKKTDHEERLVEPGTFGLDSLINEVFEILTKLSIIQLSKKRENLALKSILLMFQMKHLAKNQLTLRMKRVLHNYCEEESVYRDLYPRIKRLEIYLVLDCLIKHSDIFKELVLDVVECLRAKDYDVIDRVRVCLLKVLE